MPKIQGKQISDHTITQSNLNLSTPTTGDTTSGATVNYVNTYVSTYVANNSGTIGPAEDGLYTDGIFTDFTTGTTVGTAIDRFNEMFLLLAPAAPSTDWTNAFVTTLPILSTSTISTPRMIVTGSVTSNVVTSTLTPAFTIPSTVGSGINARTKDGTFVFTVKDYSGSTIESVTINSGSTTKSSGVLQYTISDTYLGQGAGKAGFWTGVTGFSGVSFTTGGIPAGTTPRNLYFTHPTGQSKTGTTFYVDNVTANTPSVTNLVMGAMPSMTRFISGVPSLQPSAQIVITSFSIPNVSTYFYAPSPIWASTANPGITAFNGDITNTPASVNDTGLVGSKTIQISNTYVESIGFTIQAKNRSNALAGATTGWTGTYRYDGSDESARLVSGTGNYPSTGYGTVWNSNSGTSLLTNTNELQMLNGNYQYPTVNYSSFGGPNYSTATGLRWVTKNLGTFTNNNAFTLNLTSTNITSIGQSNLDIEVKIDGGVSTSWVDANAPWSGSIPNPGSTVTNGDPAVAMGYPSTSTVRRIIFGGPTYSGNIIVRIGIPAGSNITISNVTATSIV